MWVGDCALQWVGSVSILNQSYMIQIIFFLKKGYIGFTFLASSKSFVAELAFLGVRGGTAGGGDRGEEGEEGREGEEGLNKL